MPRKPPNTLRAKNQTWPYCRNLVQIKSVQLVPIMNKRVNSFKFKYGGKEKRQSLLYTIMKNVTRSLVPPLGKDLILSKASSKSQHKSADDFSVLLSVDEIFHILCHFCTKYYKKYDQVIWIDKAYQKAAHHIQKATNCP